MNGFQSAGFVSLGICQKKQEFWISNCDSIAKQIFQNLNQNSPLINLVDTMTMWDSNRDAWPWLQPINNTPDGPHHPPPL